MKRRSKIATGSLIFLLVFVAAYLDPGVGYSGLWIPGVAPLALFAVLGRRTRAAREAAPILAALCAFSFLAWLTGEAHPPTLKAVSSFVQVCLSVVTAFLVMSNLEKYPTATLSRAAKILLVTLSVVIILEYLGPARSISSGFAAHLYSGEHGFSYYGSTGDAATRDMAMAGAVRPTAFSPEPSIAALAISLLITINFIFRRSLRNLIISFAALIGFWIIFRSPTLIAFCPLLLLIHLNGRGLTTAKLLSAYVGCCLLFAAAPLALGRMERLYTVQEAGTTTSEGIRLLLPFGNALGSFAHGNYFGVGPGAQFDSKFMLRVSPSHSTIFGTNAIAEMLFYIGPLSCALVFFLIYRRQRRLQLSGSRSAIYLCFLLIAMSLGAMESFRLLGLFAIFYACYVREFSGQEKMGLANFEGSK